METTDQKLWHLYKALLPALGANRNYPKLWRHDSLDFIGLDLLQLQVIAAVTCEFVKYEISGVIELDFNYSLLHVSLLSALCSLLSAL